MQEQIAVQCYASITHSAKTVKTVKPENTPALKTMSNRNEAKGSKEDTPLCFPSTAPTSVKDILP